MIHLYERKHQESYTMQLHHHTNYQILYVIEGNGIIQLNGKRLQLEAECVVVVLPYSEHAVASDSHLTLLVLEFDEVLFQDQVAAYWKENVAKQSEVLKLSLFHAGEMRLMLRQLLFEQQQEQELGKWAMRIHWLEVLLLLAQAKESSPLTDANALRAERVRQYIDSHYYLPLTMDQLATTLGVSSRHAASIFKERYHHTPMQYLAEVRIGVAKKLLLETEKDIISISFEVGYESLPTFYRVFKQHVQLSPSQFRQQREKSPEIGMI